MMKVRGSGGIFRGSTGATVAAAVVLIAGLVLTSCATAAKGGKSASVADPTGSASSKTASQSVIDAGSPLAPAFPTGLTWLNTAAPLTLKELRGKFVVVDFWTYGCINCMHEIPWLKKIQADFPHSVVVIGVHSAKYSHSGVTKNIRQAILRYGIDYPVVNDDRFQIWQEYGADAWPTVALIDPQGRVVGWHVGEGFYPVFKPRIASLVKKFAAKGLLDRTPLALKLEEQGLPQSVLAFPGKVRVDAKRNRMFIADTGHNRIVEAQLSTGEVTAVIGNGKQGLANGSYSRAEFDQPQGMAYSSDGKLLYVADAGNHDIRVVNLETQEVSTLVGTGKEASQYPPAPGTAPDVTLDSPWALALDGNTLYIAMAGSHQIWTTNLVTGRVQAFAGSGAEGALEGSLSSAQLAQPSGLSLSASHDRLYFANSEGSEIGYVDLLSKKVVFLAGPIANLFKPGNKNGKGANARFQHPLGVVAYHGVVYVADTYNNEIRAINPNTKEVTTIAGGPESGWRDGRQPLFYEPSGLDAANGALYIADTNNNSIRVLDLDTGKTSTLVLKGLAELTGPGDVYGVQTVHLAPLSVAPGRGVVKLEVGFPKGYEPNAQAPSEISVTSGANAVVRLTGKSRFSGPGPHFPMEFHADFKPGTTELTINLSVVYCQDVKAQVCLIHQARLLVPVTVLQEVQGPAGVTRRVLTVPYQVE